MANSQFPFPKSTGRTRAKVLQTINGFLSQHPASSLGRLQGSSGGSGSSSTFSREHTPGSYPDEPTLLGTEQLTIFPSFSARRPAQPPPDPASLISPRGAAEQQYWGSGWDAYTAASATVDIELRGGITNPHSGAWSGRERMLLSLFRTLGGIAGSTSEYAGSAAAAAAAGSRTDLGLTERDFADGPTSIRDGHFPAPAEQAEPEPDENTTFMRRVTPFFSQPRPGLPLLVIFDDGERSQAVTELTDPNGHFVVQAALPFVPTLARIYLCDRPFQTVSVPVLGPTGISVISDIDDTIKNTGILDGTRTTIRNTFVSAPEQVRVAGAAEWYRRMEAAGAAFHYVSNSPWQLYSLIEDTFAELGFPSGSVHLKQYDNLYRAFTEPVLDRKKASLTRIATRFPGRKFVLVGDSGEADLEVYTDFALTYPAQVLAILIRNLTTGHDSFSPAAKPGSRTRSSTSTATTTSTTTTTTTTTTAASITNQPPPLPYPGPSHSSTITGGGGGGGSGSGDSGFDDSEIAEALRRSLLDPGRGPSPGPRPTPPSRPAKPASLRGTPSPPPTRARPAPPPPRRSTYTPGGAGPSPTPPRRQMIPDWTASTTTATATTAAGDSFTASPPLAPPLPPRPQHKGDPDFEPLDQHVRMPGPGGAAVDDHRDRPGHFIRHPPAQAGALVDEAGAGALVPPLPLQRQQQQQLDRPGVTAERALEWRSRWAAARAKLDAAGLQHVHLMAWKTPSEEVQRFAEDLIRPFGP